MRSNKKDSKMDKTLSSIFVHLDMGMKSLSEKAIAQIIIKVLYASENAMSKAEIKDALAKINDCKHLDSCAIDETIAALSAKEIKCNKGKYYLSQSKREAIKKVKNDSENRRKYILTTYFSRMNSSDDIVSDWLFDVTIRFFESYSKEWISDLIANTSHISSSEKTIRQLITNRTNDNKLLDKDDKSRLPDMFFDFVTAHDIQVDDYLWEYGTSAFSSKLIRTMHGVDALTLDTFRNSHCFFDTNILLFIALQSRYKDAFKAIEKVFSDLNISANVLYITTQEYNNKVSSEREYTLKNLDKLGGEIASVPNDDFTTYAKSLHCKTKEDFERFFDTTLKMPSQIHKLVPIKVYDNKEIDGVITKAQRNDTLKTNLKSLANHDKSENTLCHDIGLLEGVRYLRTSDQTSEDKYFILSEDVAISRYSKNAGFKHNLPLSLRVDTLINLLAVNNDGDTFEASNYIPLFANIIRMGLVPPKDTFRQSELYNYYKMNSKLSTLPVERAKNIVRKMHEEMLDGVSNEDMLRDLNEMVTMGEIGAAKELDKTKDELHFTNKQLAEEQSSRTMAENLLYTKIRTDVEKNYDAETARLKSKWTRKIPAVIIATLIFLGLSPLFFGQYTLTIFTCLGSIIASIIAAKWCDARCEKKIIKERKIHRETVIDEEVQKQMAILRINAGLTK